MIDFNAEDEIHQLSIDFTIDLGLTADDSNGSSFVCKQSSDVIDERRDPLNRRAELTESLPRF
jgi:hypothetical protein